MELRLPLEVFPGRRATCRAVFGTWGSFPDDARASHCRLLDSSVALARQSPSVISKPLGPDMRVTVPALLTPLAMGHCSTPRPTAQGIMFEVTGLGFTLPLHPHSIMVDPAQD